MRRHTLGAAHPSRIQVGQTALHPLHLQLEGVDAP